MNVAAWWKATLTTATAQQSEACPLLTERIFFYKDLVTHFPDFLKSIFEKKAEAGNPVVAFSTALPASVPPERGSRQGGRIP